MCGIVGFLGARKQLKTIVEKLKNLEYRGYDSAGIASFDGSKLSVFKAMGSISELEKSIPEKAYSTCAIAHTRWATHGSASLINTHPHTSKNGVWTIVHNGIIENFEELKVQLSCTPKSDTDTAVVAQLLEDVGADSVQSFIDVINCLSGSYAIVAINSNHPDRIYFAKKKSPLYVADSKKYSLIASDPICFAGEFEKYFEVDEGECGIIQNGKIAFFDSQKNQVKKHHVLIDKSFEFSSKQHYAHFMLKEIFEQPSSLLSQVEFFKKTGVLNRFTKSFIEGFKRVRLVGCGTAYHASLVGSFYFKKMLGIEATAEIASEYIYSQPIFDDEHTLAVFVSQSGETADTILAQKIAKSHGATCLALTNVTYSSLAKNADIVIPICAGPEIAVASTKAYVCQLSALFMLCKHLENQIFNNHYNYYSAVENLSKKLFDFNQNKIDEIAKNIKNSKSVIFIGKGIDWVTAKEASLKLKEIAYINSSDYPAGELKHGYLALVENETTIFVFVTNKTIENKTINSLHEAVSRGASSVLISCFDDNSPDVLIHEHDEFLAPISCIVPLQYLAYKVSILRGNNPDKPRNLAKSVTVE